MNMRDTILMLVLRAMRLLGLRSFRGATIHDQALTLDHATIDRCVVMDCALVYHGAGFSMCDTHLSGCSWTFAGSAANTIEVLRHIRANDPSFIDALLGPAPKTT